MQTYWDLTTTQHDILLDQLHNPESPIYNIGGYIVCQNIDEAKLITAHQQLVSSHQVFNLRLADRAAGFGVYDAGTAKTELPIIDFTAYSDAENKAITWLDTLFQTPVQVFDAQLAHGFLLRMPEQVYWYVGMSHHLALDGWGFANWVKQLASFYNQTDLNDDNKLTFNQVVESDQQYLASNKCEKDQVFWKNHLADYEANRLTPINNTHAQPRSTRAIYPLQRTIFDKLSERAQQVRLGLPQVFMAVLAYYFSVQTNQKAILFGNPAHNRKTALQKQKLGVFTCISPLLVPVNKADTFHALVSHIGKLQKSSYRHQRYPYGKLLADQAYTGGQGSFFDFSFNYLKLDFEEVHFAGNIAKLYYHNGNAEKIPFTLTVWDNNDDHLELQIDFNHNYFCRDDIDCIAEKFTRVLTYLSEHDFSCALTELPFYTEQEQQKLLSANDNNLEYDPNLSLIAGFEHQAQLAPQKIALEVNGQKFSYETLNQKANQLAHYLHHNYHITPDTLVGISCSRSLDMLVAILATLKTGGAYLPLDPSYPVARLQQIVSDAEPIVTLTTGNEANGLATDVLDISNLDVTTFSQDNLMRQHSGQQLAYVIYTSGSTGKPKGVAINHQSVVAMLSWATQTYEASDYQRVLASTSINFDLSVFELFLPLSLGGTCILVDNALSLLTQSVDVSLINTVPSAIKTLIEQGAIPNGVKVVNLAGEPLQSDTVNQLIRGDHCERVYNLYGPSEDTTYSSYACFKQEITGQPSIGKMINNSQAYVLADDQSLLPFGAIGELYIGGDGLARGYLNQPEMTAERFIDNPFYDASEPASSTRLYRTGDLVRYQADGNLAYIGRADEQVKIRGFRIELGEVAHQLSEQPDIDSALVVAKEGPAGKYLLAYLKPVNKTEDNTHALLIEKALTTLASQLPDYMVPAQAVVLNEWPLTPNGKIDKKSLPEPCAVRQIEYLAPVTIAEQAVVNVVANLLELDEKKISLLDNFFLLGGHSLLSIKLVSNLNELGFKAYAQDALNSKNLKQLAEGLEKSISQSCDKSVHSKIPVDCMKIKPEYLDLVNLTQPQIDNLCVQVPGGATNVQDIYPLASLQEGILYHHMLAPEQDPYISWYLLKLREPKHSSLLLKAIQEVINQHDILRTCFYWQGLELPVQVVLHRAELVVNQLVLAEDVDPEKYLPDYFNSSDRKFDLHTAPLLRASLIEQGNTTHVVIEIHHLIDDAMSLTVIQQQLEAILNNEEVTTKPEQKSGFRAVIAQRNSLELDAAENFFSKMLNEVNESSLPFGIADVTGNGTGVDSASVTLTHAISQKLRKLALEHQVSPAAIFHSAWAMVVALCASQQQVVLGTVLSGRMNAVDHAETMLGMLINTLPLKFNMALNAEQLVVQAQQNLLALTRFEHVPLSLAQNCSSLKGDVPLFSALINYRHSKLQQALEEKADLNFELIDTFERTNYPFSISVDDYAQSGDFILTSLIDKRVGATRIIEYMVCAVQQLVEGLSGGNQQSVCQYNLLPESEINTQLHTWSRTEVPAWSAIHEGFEYYAEHTPQAIALVNGESKMTYAQLNTQANLVARYIKSEFNITPDTLVGVCIERSTEMMVAILAILKAGGAYLPLDPEYPSQRLTHMITDSNIRLIMTTSKCSHAINTYNDNQILLDELIIESNLVDTYSSLNLTDKETGLDIQNLAYAIYTSGSTGLPKGVLIEHANLVNFALNCKQRYSLNSQDRMLQFSTMNFDIFVEEWVASLCFGAALVLRDEQMMSSKKHFINFCLNYQITAVSLPTAFWHHLQLTADELSDLPLRLIIVGGEALEVNGLESVISQKGKCVLLNTYGPTETTITATSLLIDHQSDVTRNISIGRANINQYTLILNENDKICPVGVAGELAIAGAGLARGYLNQPELTQLKFIQHPLTELLPTDEKRLYKTGDLVKLNQRGEIEFLGRIDEQVKIRGFRVELGEIEYHLNNLAGVVKALVIAKPVTGESKQLIAYVESDIDTTKLHGKLTQKLTELLPNYMLPGFFVAISDWPIMPNGKIDRNRLPEPEFDASGIKFQAASTKTERQVSILCAELLNLEPTKLSMSAGFFDLGGHSLLAMRLVSQLNETFAINLAIQDLYQHLTITNISSHIDEVLALQQPSCIEQTDMSEFEEFTL